MNTGHEELLSDREEFEVIIKEMSEKSSDDKAEIASLKQKLKILKETLVKEKEQNSKLQTENSDLKKRLTQSERECEELKFEKINLTTDLEEQNKKILSLHLQNQSLVTHLQQSKQNAEKLAQSSNFLQNFSNFFNPSDTNSENVIALQNEYQKEKQENEILKEKVKAYEALAASNSKSEEDMHNPEQERLTEIDMARRISSTQEKLMDLKKTFDEKNKLVQDKLSKRLIESNQIIEEKKRLQQNLEDYEEVKELNQSLSESIRAKDRLINEIQNKFEKALQEKENIVGTMVFCQTYMIKKLKSSGKGTRNCLLILRKDIDENFVLEFENYGGNITLKNALDLVELTSVSDYPNRFALTFKTSAGKETDYYESNDYKNVCKAIKAFVQLAEQEYKYDYYQTESQSKGVFFDVFSFFFGNNN